MTPDQISLIHNYNISFATKTMFLTGEVNDEFAVNALKNLHILNQTSGMITIYLNSNGGDVSAGRVVYDALKGSSNYVRIICAGDIMSCATIILMAADERVMLPNAKLMMHAGEQSIADHHPQNLEKWVEQMKAESSFMNKAYLERINEKRKKDKKKLFTEKDINDMIIFDTFFSPKEALSLGFITEIGFTL